MPTPRTKQRYLNCAVCGREKITKEQQYKEVCRLCADDIRLKEEREQINSLTRKCKICNKEKPNTSEFFYWHTKSKGRLKTLCKECDDQRKNEWNHNNPEKKREQGRKTYENCKRTDRYKETARRGRRNHYYNVLINSPKEKIRGSVSKAIGSYLRRKGKSKSGQSILKYLGYTMQQLKEHLESQFDENMRWENYGEYWAIDHIIPHSFFNYTSLEDPDFKRCWSLENLRPLEKIENIKKGKKILPEFISLITPQPV